MVWRILFQRWAALSVDMKQYLGDGVYVDVEENWVVLTTEDGVKETNRIYLDQEVQLAFMKFMDGIYDETH